MAHMSESQDVVEGKQKHREEKHPPAIVPRRRGWRGSVALMPILHLDGRRPRDRALVPLAVQVPGRARSTGFRD